MFAQKNKRLTEISIKLLFTNVIDNVLIISQAKNSECNVKCCTHTESRNRLNKVKKIYIFIYILFFYVYFLNIYTYFFYTYIENYII